MQLLFAFYSVAAGTLMALEPGVSRPMFQTAATICYPLAALLSFWSLYALGNRALAPRTRRLLIVFHLVYLPSQFFFLFVHDIAWLGMALSAMVVGGLKPRFPRLGRLPRKVWLTLHIGLGVGWLGVALAMLGLSVIGATTADPVVRHGAYVIMNTFDVALAIPSLFLAVVTGTVLGLGTPWGVFRHWWVLIKLVIALTLPVLATYEGAWIERLAERTLDPAAEPGGLGAALVGAMALFLALLWTAVVLSVFKPGGRIRRERRGAERSPRTPVTVAAVGPIAEGVVSLELTRSGGGALPRWEPGAHIDVVLPSGLVRQYSLCGDPASTESYRIAVLLEPDGRGGSAEIHRLRPGAELTVRGPRNHFELVDAPAYLLIAGGIGIAPLLPMIDRLADAGADWQLVYRGRSAAQMAFAEDLRRRHPRRVLLAPADSRPRPDLEALLRAAPAGTAVYCCGPREMLDAVEAAMPSARPDGSLHTERFAARARDGEAVDAPFEAELRAAGVTVQVPADRSLLSVIQDVRPGLDFSCEDGVCGSCEVRVLDGVPDHRDEVLRAEERERRDLMYPCVSRARGERIVLDV